jgi:hypothetical protein
VDCFRARPLRRIYDPVTEQVALARRRGSDEHGFIGLAYMRSACVGLAVNRYSPYSELLAGADYAKRNLTAIRDQNFAKQAW